ncbi:DMP19 family protein [Acidovorax sp.]|uniref:DMP19 family protein n=1 Tax=Acidovorax sp. TaxID=1872122 RepID=UPI004037C0E1
MTQSLLERASAYATAKVLEADGCVSRLPEALQTVVVINTTQGIIDNGGLEYFYESDFPTNLPYSFFAETFRRIGVESVASCIDESSRMFPFPEPHLHEAKRRTWLDSVKDDEAHPFVHLSRKACGDELVFQKLAEYVDRHRDAFGAA